MKKFTYGSLFSGIGGIDLGLDRSGWECKWQCEIDPFCLKVLDRHWPQVKKYGDIREVNTDELEPVDLVCGGFPCQDLSLAGKRAGLAGERSGLFYELLRVADSNPASWVLAENVPGLLSSAGGADFATVLGELSGFFPEVPADGWRNSGVCVGPKGCVAWRVLDAEFFGVPQRRRRVFIVRSPSTARGSAFEVLFEPDCVSGSPPPSRKEGERLTGTPTEGFGSRGVDADQIANGNYAINEMSLCLKASGSFKQDTTHETYIVASTLRSGGDGGIPSSRGENLIRTVYGFQGQDLAHAIRSNPSKADKPSSSTYVCTLGHTQSNGLGIYEQDVTNTLEAVSSANQAVVVTSQDVTVEPANQCASRIGGWVDREDRVFAYQNDAKRSTAQELIFHKPQGKADSLTQQKQNVIVPMVGVRRLTPTECERLQGFPDGWTLLGDKTPDSPRYKACGNAVCVNVAEWIGRRLMSVISEVVKP